MHKKIVYKDENGLNVCTVADHIENVEEYSKKIVPSGSVYCLLEASEVPKRHQESWDIKDGRIVPDMAKARELHSRRMKERASLILEKLAKEHASAFLFDDSLGADKLKKEALEIRELIWKGYSYTSETVDELWDEIPAILSRDL